RRAGGGLEGRTGEAVRDALEAGPVGEERLPPAVEVVAPAVPEAAREDVQLPRLWPELPDAAGVEPTHAVGGFDMAVDVDGLVEVTQPVRAPAERVDHVVRVLGAEAREDDALAVRLAVAVGVRQVDQFGAGADVDPPVAGLDAGGDEQPVGEDGDLVRLAGTLG